VSCGLKRSSDSQDPYAVDERMACAGPGVSMHPIAAQASEPRRDLLVCRLGSCMLLPQSARSIVIVVVSVRTREIAFPGLQASRWGLGVMQRARGIAASRISPRHVCCRRRAGRPRPPPAKRKPDTALRVPARCYTTTPIDYVNGRPHVGHDYEKVLADAIARFHRQRGDATFFLTGTDEHGQKIAQAAAAAKQDPQAFVDAMAEHFKATWK